MLERELLLFRKSVGVPHVTGFTVQPEKPDETAGVYLDRRADPGARNWVHSGCFQPD